ncbi:peptidase S41 [Pararhodospirillum oryzae]|uniref:Peptidase S41 n=2 Tax=Pararhodospirillum oryzae TaxID=478448 RepID=A0A512H7F2_9PROT|nr:peptidase S41 [Pararhodospirillum oryzae]
MTRDAPSSPLENAGAPFSRPDATTLFSVAFDAIAQRYLEPVNLESLAVAGLKGLRTLDDHLSIRRTGAVLEVGRRDTVLGVFRLPAAQDTASWGRLVASALGLLHDASPPLRDLDGETLYKAVFDAALAHLDPFSHYASAEAATLNRGARNGFGGLGLLYDLTDGQAIVTRVFAETPAAEAGLAAGDRILAIDGQTLRGLSNDTVRDQLRGPSGSLVTLLVASPGVAAPRAVTLTRTLIVLPTVEWRLEGDSALITVSSFNQRTTTAVAEAISAAQAKSRGALKGVILDLRGNPGGLLDQAVALSDLFMERGPIVSTRGRHPDARQFYSATPGDLTGGLPLVVLIDGESASAAEIVAAALQDSGRAVVVGTTSYGKGTVQTVLPLPNGGEITLTWSRFHSPSGYVLHGLGVMPVACTGGHAAPLTPEAVVAGVRAHLADTASLATVWRATDPRNVTRRATLRQACPPAPHAGGTLDDGVAHDLLADPALFDQALRVTPTPQATAGRP